MTCPSEQLMTNAIATLEQCATNARTQQRGYDPWPRFKGRW